MGSTQTTEQMEYSEVSINVRVPKQLWEKWSETAKALGWTQNAWWSGRIEDGLEELFVHSAQNDDVLACFMNGPEKEDHEQA